MEIKTKYSIGQEVVIFNGGGLIMVHDCVFAILHQPVEVEGKKEDPSKTLAENLKAGNLVVEPRYQLKHVNALLPEKAIFESEDACRAALASI